MPCPPTDHVRSSQSDLDRADLRLLRGSLLFAKKRVAEILTPTGEVFTLHTHVFVDAPLLASIRASGFSRIPVIDNGGERDDEEDDAGGASSGNQSQQPTHRRVPSFVGILLVKNLLGVLHAHPNGAFLSGTQRRHRRCVTRSYFEFFTVIIIATTVLL